MQSKGQSAIVNFSLSSKISLKKCLSLTPPVSYATAHPIRQSLMLKLLYFSLKWTKEMDSKRQSAIVSFLSLK